MSDITPTSTPASTDEQSPDTEPGGTYRLPGTRLPTAEMPEAGTPPGMTPEELHERICDGGPVDVTCVDYNGERFEIKQLRSAEALEAFLQHHRPDWSEVRWIDVRGLDNVAVVRALATKYQLHPLAVEDLYTPQQAKCEDYPATAAQPQRLFVTAVTVHKHDKQYHRQQVAFFLGRNTLLTFQTDPNDLFETIRERMALAGSPLRTNDASFLLYSLLDVMVDLMFPVLDRVSHHLERIESRVLEEQFHGVMREVYVVKQRLMLMRRAVWPMRELIHQLLRDPHECLSDQTRIYLRDVYDHIIYVVDLSETYRDFAAGLAESYRTALANRTNDIMKTLTIISTIFVPLTFLAGVYGMNMPLPEQNDPRLFIGFLGISAATMAGMAVYFWRKGWIFNREGREKFDDVELEQPDVEEE